MKKKLFVAVGLVAIGIAARSEGLPSLTWQKLAATNAYAIQFKSDLWMGPLLDVESSTNLVNWQKVPNPNPDSPVRTYLITNVLAKPQEFFRIVGRY